MLAVIYSIKQKNIANFYIPQITDYDKSKELSSLLFISINLLINPIFLLILND